MNTAVAPLNWTADASVKSVPVMVTAVPTAPDVGAKSLIVGAGVGGTVTVNIPDITEPAGDCTDIVADTAPEGTAVSMRVDETTVNTAGLAPNLTEVAPVKFAPFMVTAVPTGPLVGEMPVIVGAGCDETVKLDELVAVPVGVVTAIGPEIAPSGTVAYIRVCPEVRNAALVPLNLTAVTPMKLDPLIVTLVPGKPLDGENLLIAGGGGTTVKLVELVAVPPDVRTLIGPVDAYRGTVAVMEVLDTMLKVALVPLN